jgi:hypothetical protein
MYPPRSASNLWKNLNKSTRWIHSFLGWNPGSGHSILLGKDQIVGMEQHSFLSPQLIHFLNSKNIYYLFHVSVIHRVGYPLNKWISSLHLDLLATLATKWNRYCHHLASTGIQLHTSEDQPTWTGGDRLGFLSTRNVYTGITNHHWPINTCGWKYKLWTWSLPLKLKLFF